MYRGLWKPHIWNPRPYCAYSLSSTGLRWRLKPRSHRARQRASTCADASNQTNVKDSKHLHRPRRRASTRSVWMFTIFNSLIWCVSVRWRVRCEQGSRVVYSWASPLLSDCSALRIRRITWPISKGSLETTLFGIPDRTLPIHYLTLNFYRAAITIKGSLLVSVPIVKRFSAENFLSRQNRSQKSRFFSRKWWSIY